jgi:hypothetical protein
MNDSALKYILIVVVVAAASFLGGRFSKRCPQADPALIEILTAKVEEQERNILSWRTLADRHKAVADSIQNLPKPDVETVLPRVPVGRTDAGLDSLRAILLREP